MFQQTLTIARNTFVESIRQPIYGVLIFVAAVFLAINPFLAAYSMDVQGTGDNKMLVDIGLSILFVAGILIAAFTATVVLSEEVDNKTVLTVISKPVSRPLFVVGKYLGVAGAIAMAYYVLSLIFILTFRHKVMQNAADPLDLPVLGFGLGGATIALIIAGAGNYLYRKVFTSTFVLALTIAMTLATLLVLVIDKQWQLQSPLTEFVIHQGQLTQVCVGLLLVLEAVLLLTAVAVACSTRLGQVMTLLVCLGVFVIGLVSNSFSQLVDDKLALPAGLGVGRSMGAILGADTTWTMKGVFLVSKLLYLLIPNLQFLWPADAITQGRPLSAVHVATVTGYAALYTAVVLCLAVALFQSREVG